MVDFLEKVYCKSKIQSFMPVFINWLLRCSVSIERMRKFLTASELDKKDEDEIKEKPEIKIDSATFKWNDEAKPILENVSFEAGRGQLVAIAGSVGSGKSSMVEAIIGSLKE